MLASTPIEARSLVLHLRGQATGIGTGSDVLGYDTPMSRDHMWGPRLVLFLPEDRLAETGPQVDQRLRQELPPVFHGYPTHFGAPDKEGVRRMEAVDGRPVILESPTACHRLQYLYMNDRNNESTS